MLFVILNSLLQMLQGNNRVLFILSIFAMKLETGQHNMIGVNDFYIEKFIK